MTAFKLLLFLCAGLGVSAIAIRLGDRQTLVPAPEARVEAFLRELQTHRSQLAVKYLSDDLRQSAAATALQQAFNVLEASIGDVENVDAETLTLDRQSATARGKLVTIKGGPTTLDFGLKWQRGEWAIAVLPEPLSVLPPVRMRDDSDPRR